MEALIYNSGKAHGVQMLDCQIDLLTVDLLFNFERIKEITIENMIFVENHLFRFFTVDVSFDTMKISNITMIDCFISSFLTLTSPIFRSLLIIDSKFLEIKIIDDKMFFFIATPGIYEITNSTFKNLKLIDPVKTNFIFAIENQAKFIFSGNQVLNCGSQIIENRIFSNSLTSLDVNGLFLFWNNFYPIFIDFCIFKNVDGMTQNSNGFIYGESNIQLKINNSIFEIANHNEKMLYKGLVFCKTKELTIENSVFDGLRCHNLTKIYEKSTILIFHNFGKQIAKNFTVNITNNFFINCICKEFGVLSIFNYGYSFLNYNNFIGFNEAGEKRNGAVVSIITSLKIEIKNTFLSNNVYVKSYCFFIETAKFLNLENTIINNINSLGKNGVISLNFILTASIMHLYSKNTQGILIQIVNTKCEIMGLNVFDSITLVKGLIYVKGQESFCLKNVSISYVYCYIFILIFVEICYTLRFEGLIVENIQTFFNPAIFDQFFDFAIFYIRYVENHAIFSNIVFSRIAGRAFELETNNDNATFSFKNLYAQSILKYFISSFASVTITLENIFLTEIFVSAFRFNWYYEKDIVIQNLTVVNSDVESIFQLFSLNFEIKNLNFTNIECKISCCFFKDSNVTLKNAFIKLKENYNAGSKAIFSTFKAFVKIIDLQFYDKTANLSKNYVMQINESTLYLANIFLKDISNKQAFFFRIIDSNTKYNLIYFF